MRESRLAPRTRWNGWWFLSAVPPLSSAAQPAWPEAPCSDCEQVPARKCAAEHWEVSVEEGAWSTKLLLTLQTATREGGTWVSPVSSPQVPEWLLWLLATYLDQTCTVQWWLNKTVCMYFERWRSPNSDLWHFWGTLAMASQPGHNFRGLGGKNSAIFF